MATDVDIRAEQARQLLENPVFKENFYPLQVAIIEEISATDPADTNRLAMLALKLQVMEEFRQQLLDPIETLTIEKHESDFESPTLM